MTLTTTPDRGTTMRAVVLHGPGDLRVEQQPVPSPGPGEVRVAVDWGGICGSDLSYWRHGASGTAVQRHPLVLGHEIAGTVAELGDGVIGVGLGDAVTVHPATVEGRLPEQLHGRDNLHPDLRYLGSAARDPHTQGGFAEQLVVRADQLRALPAGLSTRAAAVAEPLGVALHAIARAGSVAGLRVLVSGCGPIGALIVAAAVHQGADVTAIDPSERARGIAAALGAGATLDLGQPVPDDFDVVFEASGVGAAVSTAIDAVRPGGVMVQVGNLPADAVQARLGKLVSREIDLRGSYRFVDEITDAVAALADGLDIDPVVSHEFGLDELEQAFATAADSRASCKVLLRF
jgi:L-idonate 5-dehydrogenase